MAVDIEILGCGGSSQNIEIDNCCAAVVDGGVFSPGDFVLRPELVAASGGLQNQINGLNSVSTGSLTGAFYPRFQNPSGYLTSIDLSGELTTGLADLRYYPLLTNPSGYISNSGFLLIFQTGGLTGQFINRIESGNFYSITNPNNYLSSGVTGHLISDWQTGGFYPIYNPNNYLTSGSTGNLTGAFVQRNESGQFYSIQNINNYCTSGNLFTTGANLFTNDTILSGKIISLSGDFTSHVSNDLTGISVTGGNSLIGRPLLTGIGGFTVAQSGQTITFSGADLIGFGTTGTFDSRYYNISNPNNYSTSGNLYSTGSYLLNQVLLASGDPTLVRTTGAQTIVGIKTFTNKIIATSINNSSDVISIGLNGEKSLYHNGAIVLDWTAGQLIDTASRITLDWNGKWLKNSNNLISADWETKTLSGDWIAGTIPTLSGHVVNKFYLDQQTGFLYPKYNPNNYATSGYYGGSGAAPSTNTLTVPVTIPAYGTVDKICGNPAGWLDITISGVARKIPFY